MADRSRVPARPDGSPYVPAAPRVRHVWVRTSVKSELVYAGLVLCWRRQDDARQGSGWFAQVAYVPVGYDDTNSLVVSWVAAEDLRPVVPR